jgi:hypothetical protein
MGQIGRVVNEVTVGQAPVQALEVLTGDLQGLEHALADGDGGGDDDD